MAKLTVSVTKNTIDVTLKQIQRDLSGVPLQAYQEMVQLTPKQSGNARSKTNLVSNSVIRANYPYAKRLDEGYSKQAPRGMTQPLRQWLQRKLQSIMRKR